MSTSINAMNTDTTDNPTITSSASRRRFRFSRISPIVRSDAMSSWSTFDTIVAHSSSGVMRAMEPRRSRFSELVIRPPLSTPAGRVSAPGEAGAVLLRTKG